MTLLGAEITLLNDAIRVLASDRSIRHVQRRIAQALRMNFLAPSSYRLEEATRLLHPLLMGIYGDV